jgi:hypothetical protein
MDWLGLLAAGFASALTAACSNSERSVAGGGTGGQGMGGGPGGQVVGGSGGPGTGGNGGDRKDAHDSPVDRNTEAATDLGTGCPPAPRSMQYPYTPSTCQPQQSGRLHCSYPSATIAGCMIDHVCICVSGQGGPPTCYLAPSDPTPGGPERRCMDGGVSAGVGRDGPPSSSEVGNQPVCQQIERDYQVALAEAKRCGIDLGRAPCAIRLAPGPGCPSVCTTFIDAPDRLPQIQALFDQNCPGPHPCAGASCPSPSRAVCVPLTTGSIMGVCQDVFPDGGR